MCTYIHIYIYIYTRFENHPFRPRQDLDVIVKDIDMDTHIYICREIQV